MTENKLRTKIGESYLLNSILKWLQFVSHVPFPSESKNEMWNNLNVKCQGVNCIFKLSTYDFHLHFVSGVFFTNVPTEVGQHEKATFALLPVLLCGFFLI